MFSSVTALARLKCHFNVLFLKVVFPSIFVFSFKISYRNYFRWTECKKLVVRHVHVNSPQDAFILEVLIVYYFSARNFTNNCYVCGVHKTNVEQSYGETSWQFSFHRLVAFLFKILDLFQILCFQH